ELGQVGLEWSVAGFGSFSGNANETDMLMRNSTTGDFVVYDIANNQVVGFHALGTVGLEWSVAGFGNLSAHAHPTDMPTRNGHAREVYDITSNTVMSATAMGSLGLEWQVAGIAADPPSAPPTGATSPHERASVAGASSDQPGTAPIPGIAGLFDQHEAASG